MGKKRRRSSSEEAKEEGKKKKKDEKKKKKAKKEEGKKAKKEGKNAKASKKVKKQASNSSSSSSVSSSGNAEAKCDAVDAATAEAKPAKAATVKTVPVQEVELPPLEEGIQRFHFSVEEEGSLGVRFSGGFPPLVLNVNPDSHASKKGMPINVEVHAINGLPLVLQNRDTVMHCLKLRPVVLDVRPQGWKPKEKVKEIERKRAAEEAEKGALIEMEAMRRDQVARDAAELAEREAVERASHIEKQSARRREKLEHAREARVKQVAAQEAFFEVINAEPQMLRDVAADLMEADFGSSVRFPKGSDRRGLPLRMLTRRQEVAWIWGSELQPIIGGGAPDSNDVWS
eukprot:NODE_4158_length_1928_cov_7.997779.p1 GENE.NODE_4158_length_1928_cov_7.997779~~NODE_4158_length_1928_cov_7.997779.p1  ORF type:complete len:343 (-),score=153.02 NODE_4158_length_1928_cov_7.997779:824-1852(-)